MTTRLVDHALSLAENHAWAVFPTDNEKHPRVKDWPNVASTDPATIERWWARWPDANIGIACGASGLVVVDLDIKNGSPGLASWAALCTRLGIEAEPETPTVRTPTAGQHIYFDAPLELSNTVGRLGLGIDTRAVGGYVVAPPSSTGDGAYTWTRRANLKPLPDALVDLLRKPSPTTEQRTIPPSAPTGDLSRYVQKALDAELATVAGAPEGSRNDSLNDAAFSLGQLVGSTWANLDEDRAASLLLDAARSCGLPESEARRTIHSGLTSGREQPRPTPVRAPENARELETSETITAINEKEDKRGRPRTPRLLTSNYVGLFREWGFSLRLNLCNDDIEVNGETLSDVIEHQILSRVRDYGISNRVGINVQHAREAMTRQAAVNSYHPVKDYLNALKWDGQDHLGDLAQYFTDALGCEGRFLAWFGHWLVGAVAKVYEGFQNPMLVIDGEQELGKSYFARWLCPLERQFYAGAIYPDNKDCTLRVIDTWVWEVEEVGGTTRHADLEALKAFLTRDRVRDRKPYGHRDIVKPALASYLGTINSDAGFLVDRTGNRRFLVTSVAKIDWAYADDVDVDQLWAQAVFIYRQGDAWKLTEADRKDRDLANTEYMIDDPIEAILSEILEYTGEMADRVTLPQLLGLLRDKCTVSQRSQSMTVASVLKSWGAVKRRVLTKGKRVTVYYGVKVDV